MSAALRTAEDYELFLYSLVASFPSVSRSTLVLIRRGATLALVSGELQFRHGIRLVVRERLLFDRQRCAIDAYGYEVWRHTVRLWWYDSQPHSDDASLAATHPHHKHVVPNMKRNCVPAPGLAFDRPNLPFLIREIGTLLSDQEGS